MLLHGERESGDDWGSIQPAVNSPQPNHVGANLSACDGLCSCKLLLVYQAPDSLVYAGLDVPTMNRGKHMRTQVHSHPVRKWGDTADGSPWAAKIAR